MGRVWHFVGGGGGDKPTKREKTGERGTSSSPPGCMAAVFHLFDFHHFHPCFNQHQPSFQPHSCLHEDLIIPKGIEAPRNSLESEEVFMAAGASFSPIMENEQENLKIPMGIQVKTNMAGYSPESSYSPSTKSPNLVARLMGLDLLPLDCHSHSPTPSPSSSNHNPHGTQTPLRKSHLHHQTSRSSRRRTYSENDIMATRSLPETPRVSSERKSDVDYHHHRHDHRLSLQLIREKVMENDENRPSTLSPSHYYAKQIVKQVRESVGRKVGLDITNTVKNISEERRDEHLLGIKMKKSSKNLVKVFGDELIPSKHSTLTLPSTSCSPRLRLLEHKNKSITSSISSIDNRSNLVKVSMKTKSQQLQEQQQQQQQQQQYMQPQQRSQKCTQKSKKVTGEGLKSRHEKPVRNSEIIRNNKEEHFVRPSTTASRAKHSEKKTPLSNDFLNVVTVRTLLPLKKCPSPPATKLPQKQVAIAQGPKRGSQLSSISCLTFKQQATHTSIIREIKNNTYGNRPEFKYVTKILKCTGIDMRTQVSFAKWFSPSHPIDPSIFNYLESIFSTTTTTVADWSDQLSHQSNRRLIFHLVDEILVEILRPYINMKPWLVWGPSMHYDHGMKGSHLIEKLCTRIKSYPMANCEDLEDIDALIDKDLHEPTHSNSSTEFEEEGESIVLDIEKDIMDSLVHETMVALYGGFLACPYSD